MKTESEIRRYRDNLRTIREGKLGCDCAATGHSLECQVGGKMMTAVEMVLGWILDENPKADRLVTNVKAHAQRIRAEKN